MSTYLCRIPYAVAVTAVAADGTRTTQTCIAVAELPVACTESRQAPIDMMVVDRHGMSETYRPYRFWGERLWRPVNPAAVSGMPASNYRPWMAGDPVPPPFATIALNNLAEDDVWAELPTLEAFSAAHADPDGTFSHQVDDNGVSAALEAVANTLLCVQNDSGLTLWERTAMPVYRVQIANGAVHINVREGRQDHCRLDPTLYLPSQLAEAQVNAQAFRSALSEALGTTDTAILNRCTIEVRNARPALAKPGSARYQLSPLELQG